MKLFNYIFGWLFFVNGIAGTLYVLLLSVEGTKPLIPIQDTDFVLFVLVGAVMIGIGAVLDRLDSMKEREDAAKPDIPVLTDRLEPRLSSASDY
jgi:hypothetical protein